MGAGRRKISACTLIRLRLVLTFSWPKKLLTTYEFPKKYFSEHQLLSFKEVSLVRRLDSTLVKHRAPCIAHRDGRPRQSDATGLESVFVHYKAGLGTQVPKGLTTYLGPKAHPNPPTFGLKAM